MKKVLTTLLLALSAISSFAADFVVNATGFGTPYTTISAAITAAGAGAHRILVYPIAGGGAYVESPNLLAGQQLINAVENTKYKVTGNITAGGAGCLITGADVTGNIVDNGGTASNTRIVGCKVSGRIYAAANTIGPTYIENDTIAGHTNVIYRGRVSGCVYMISSSPGGNTFILRVESQAVNGNDTVFVVGNTFICSNASGASMVVHLLTSTSYFYVADNYMRTDFSNGTFMLQLDIAKNGTSRNHYINNTGYNAVSNTQGNCFINAASISPALVDIKNNVFVGNSGYPSFYFYGISGANISVKYNYVSNTSGGYQNHTPDATNNSTVGNTTLNMDGTLIAGSAAINGGDPFENYLDLDLTVNDAGCYGGSYSLTNFQGANTGSRVLFMRAPRSFYSTPGGTISISADGIDK